MKRLHHWVGSLFLGQYPSLLRHPLSTRSEFLETECCATSRPATCRYHDRKELGRALGFEGALHNPPPHTSPLFKLFFLKKNE